MGMDPNQALAFLDMIGIAEENPSWIMAYKDDTNYRNQMKFM